MHVSPALIVVQHLQQHVAAAQLKSYAANV
jgi:hypothetical protein